MASVNGENANDFFDSEGHKLAIMRCFYGHDKAADSTNFMTELAEVEADHAKTLNRLAERWAHDLSKTDEYGEMGRLCRTTIGIVQAMADSHEHFSVSLTDQLIPKLRNWRKESYQKKGMLSYVVVDDAEKKFTTIQNKWLDFEAKLKKLKTEYLAATKAMCEAEIAEDKSSTEEQRRKRAEKLFKAKEEMEFSKKKYHYFRQEMRNRRTEYELEMTHIFNQLDLLEEERLNAFAEQFEDFGTLVRASTTENEKLKSIIDKYHDAVTSYEPTKDLAWWNKTFGPKNTQETQNMSENEDDDSNLTN